VQPFTGYTGLQPAMAVVSSPTGAGNFFHTKLEWHPKTDAIVQNDWAVFM
jgi:hypothetical protein